MKTRNVVFTLEAEDDLTEIYDYIADQGAPLSALGFAERIEIFCQSLGHAAERGLNLAANRQGIRAIGFERRVTIVFQISDETVSILRIYRAGRNWSVDFS